MRRAGILFITLVRLNLTRAGVSRADVNRADVNRCMDREWLLLIERE